MKKNTIFCIVGASGTGKTTIAEAVSKQLNIPVICSYTTRPMRDGEVNGKDHWFVTESEMEAVIADNKLCAYTLYGGYHYFTSTDQLVDNSIYVIDEAGVNPLIESGKYNIVVIELHCFPETLTARGISKERQERDKQRVPLIRKPDVRISTNMTHIINKNNVASFISNIIKKQ